MAQKIKVSHILLDQKYEAEDVLKKLQSGGDFFDLAARFSQCSSARQGGFLGEVASHRLDPEFAEAALDLQPNEVSGVVRTRFGYHIIKRG